MQLWNFAKCRQTAEDNGAALSEHYIKICRLRKAIIAVGTVCILLMAVLVAVTVMHSEERTWEEAQTHETVAFELKAEDCVEYSMDMTEGEFVKSRLVMPSKSFTLNADGGQDTYYVYLDNAGAEGIFCFADEPIPEVEAWLDGWENLTDSMPEPVEILGRRGTMSISGSGDLEELAAAYNGKSFIEAGSYAIEREVAIDGAEDRIAQIEAEKQEFEERREMLFDVMIAVFALLVASIAAFLVDTRLYRRAVRAYMADNGAE